jgi:CHAT domain-containing protein
MNRRSLALAGALACAMLTASAQEGSVFSAVAAESHTISRGAVHRYAISVKAGEYVAIDVVQVGVDIEVCTFDPSDEPVAEFHDAFTRGGVEHAEVVGEASGDYTLTVALPQGIVTPGTYTIRTVARRAATDADRTMQESRRSRAQAASLMRAGSFDVAQNTLAHALTIAEGVREPDDPYVIGVVRDLAENALVRRDTPRATSLYQSVLSVLLTLRGGEDPETALVQSRLAVLYDRVGDRAKAESVLRQAMDVFEKTVGTDHPWYVQSLITQSNLRSNGGDRDRAIEIDEQALAIVERTEGPDSRVHSVLLGNLGDVYRQKGDLTRADEYLRQALDAQSRQNPESFDVSTALLNLAIVARERHDYAAAEAYCLRSVAIREKLEGPDHPDVAQALINLANVYKSKGEDAHGLEIQQRALHIWETSSGPYERGTLVAVGNIARTYAGMGDYEHALAYQQRVDALIEMHLALNLAVGSEREKIAFARLMAERTDRTISLHLNRLPNDPRAGALAAAVLLQRKGRVQDAMADTFAAVRQHTVDAASRKRLDDLNSVRSQLARLSLSPMGSSTNPAVHRQQLAMLEARKERLESELSADSAELRMSLGPVTVEAVQAAMPDDAALIEFAVFRPFDPKIDINAEAYAPAHYAAYVIRKSAPPRGFDLGPAKSIDELVDNLRQAIRDPHRDDAQALARVVDERVLRPLRVAVGDATRLLISPDGDLNLIPFEALIDPQGQFAIERYTMTYLTSGRDLLRMQVARASHTPGVIVDDPFFGEPPPTPPGAKSPIYFPPLAGTAAEARSIRMLFPDVVELSQRQATKSALQHLDAPRLLHIASHGWFMPDAAGSPMLNPLLRSGLALAGANLPGSQREAGILTASEASGLNLWGTRLVTLSACDTGLGEVRNGEGVYGLRRAFVLAGAETLVMSLWPVSDYVTRETMTAYYTGLRSGLGRGDALREAKIAMLRRAGRRHPFYWASFIQSGEWAGLDDQR